MICSANQWTGFYMISASVMKELTLNYQRVVLRKKLEYHLLFKGQTHMQGVLFTTCFSKDRLLCKVHCFGNKEYLKKTVSRRYFTKKLATLLKITLLHRRFAGDSSKLFRTTFLQITCE